MTNKELLDILDQAAHEGQSILDFRGQGLTTLPPQIGQLTTLKEILLDSNQLTRLPPEIGQLGNLATLELGNNLLTMLPHEIGQLSNLTKLTVHTNQLSTLPPEIAQLRNLRLLGVGTNRLIALPPQFGQLSNLVELYLDNNQLTTLPPAIGQLVNLRKLDLARNLLQVLPPEIGRLSKLMMLGLGGNRLTRLPPHIGRLQSLAELYLDNNQLTEVPPEIGQLTNLTRLDLFRNQLSALPIDICQLSRLRYLGVAANHLTALPPPISGLNNLVELFLDNNQLTTLPPAIGQLTNLNLLTLQGNPLTALPPEIVQLTRLERFHIDSIVPPELVAQGTKAILAYFHEQLQESHKRWVSKLLVIGEAGVGKTATLHSLRGESFQESLETTSGIDVLSLDLPHPAIPDVLMQLNTWDFGGQEIYHATHQFFLTNRSLFLLVWNARYGFEQCKLYYWLDIIKARAPESPVLIVATHIDEGDARLPQQYLREKYPQIIRYCEISNKTGEGIESLRGEIADAAAKLPLMGETWPANWLNASRAIGSRPERWITAREFRELMAQHNVTNDKLPALAQWLHELGDILYFQDDEELNDIVILNAAWVTKSISQVLTSKEVIDNQGVFTRAHMETLWQSINPSLRDHFLRLMERFDLSYRTLVDKKEISLVVERLPLDPPHYETAWNAIKARGVCNEISMKFQLESTMPPGVPTWFIARSYRFTTHTHWHYGALLADGPEGRHLGLIQTFPHDQYLRLTIRGPQPHNFFALLRDGLEVTLARFPGLKIHRRIPCPGHDGQLCSYEFGYEDLQRAIELQPPVKELQCQKAFKSVSVPGLLFGLDWRTQDDVLEAIEKLEAASGGWQAELLTQQAEMLALLQREFTNLFRREQGLPESHCPNVFVLRPIGQAHWLKTLFGENMELQLYCQAPGCWHPTKEGGRYIIDKPARWLNALSPYLLQIVKVLKHTVPLVSPLVGMAFSEYEELIKSDIALMNELVKQLPDVKDAPELQLAETPGEPIQPERIEGAELRALRLLLKELDPLELWGGLKKQLTPEGHYLWLCEDHIAEYKR